MRQGSPDYDKYRKRILWIPNNPNYAEWLFTAAYVLLTISYICYNFFYPVYGSYMLRYALSILLSFLGIYPMLAQKMNNNLELQKKASDNHSPSRDYELMLVKADSTILQAQKLNLPLDELSGLSSKCNYFNG